MVCVRIEDPQNRQFPFNKELFEDRRVLYHGSWSTCSETIESAGFVPSDRPFAADPFIAISTAMETIGLPSTRSLSQRATG